MATKDASRRKKGKNSDAYKTIKRKDKFKQETNDSDSDDTKPNTIDINLQKGESYLSKNIATPVNYTPALEHFTNNDGIYALMSEKASSKHFGARHPGLASEQPTAMTMVPAKVNGVRMAGVMVSEERRLGQAIAINQMNEVERQITGSVGAVMESRKTPEQREEERLRAERLERQEREFHEGIAQMKRQLAGRLAAASSEALGIVPRPYSGSEDEDDDKTVTASDR
jgi:hypothetical protein